MTAKEWMLRAKNIDIEITALERERQSAFERACSMTQPIDGERVSVSGSNLSERSMLKYIEYSDAINECIDKLYDVKKEINSAIEQIEDATLRSILIMRYLQFESWERIAKCLSYSSRQVTRLNGQALLLIQKVIGK